jgi:hypothetical protein
MNKTTIKVTDTQLDRFLDRVSATPSAPVGEHLTDAEAIGYKLGLLDSEAMQAFEGHLATCAECAELMEELSREPKAWRSAATHERLATIGQRLMDEFQDDTEAITDSPIQIVKTSIGSAIDEFQHKLQVAIAKHLPRMELKFGSKHPPAEVATDDGSFGACLETLENGDLSVSVGSRETSLANQTACIVAGEKRWIATFHKVKIRGTQQVVAELLIERKDLMTLPRGSVLKAEFGRHE